jgi:hypothetical protein
VRFDESGGDPDVGVHPLAVQPDRHAIAVDTEPDQLSLIACVVVDDPHRVDDLVTEHLAQLSIAVAAVSTGRDQDHDISEVDHVLQFREYGRDHQVPRLRAGAIAGRDRHGLAPSNAIAQRWSGNGLTQYPAQNLDRVGCSLMGDGLHHGRTRGVHVDGQSGLAVRQTHSHST